MTIEEYNTMREREYYLHIVDNTYTKRVNVLRDIDNEPPIDHYLTPNGNITENINEANIYHEQKYGIELKKLSSEKFLEISENNINEEVQRLRKIELSIYNIEKDIRKHYKVGFSSYYAVSDPENWLKCPKCHLKPITWEFDNGRYTSCGCGEDRYDCFSIRAQSIMSVYHRDGNTANYSSDELKRNWNHYVLTGEKLFERNFDEQLW